MSPGWTRWTAAATAAIALGCAGATAHAQVPRPTATPAAPVIAAAGDIACDPQDAGFNAGAGTSNRCRQSQTAQKVLELDPVAVLPLGDTQYEDAQLWKFQQSYDLSWGRLKSISRPVIGNHEYFVDGATGYFDYFNGVGAFSGIAGDRDKAYYSYDIGDWHLVALNSQCSAVGGCGFGSPQEQWLRADLAAHPNDCTLAYMHHPLVSSAGVGWPSVQPLWRTLQDHGVDLVLAGHAHMYERFAPLDWQGGVDPANGIPLIVVGTGGKNLSAARGATPGSEAITTGAFGILAVTLRKGAFEWRFVRESGEDFSDSGTSTCKGPPAGRPPEAATGTPGSVRGTTARLTGAIDDRGQGTTYRFEYGQTPAYGAATPEVALPTTPAGPRSVSARISGLRPGAVYHYRLVATNGSGVTFGENRLFRAARRSRYADAVDRTPGLMSHWRLGDGTGGYAFDTRGVSLGMYAGGYALSQRGAPAGDRDTSAAFDGTSGHLRLYGPPVNTRGSLEGWFRWRAGEVLFRDDSAAGGWYLRDSGGRISYRVGGTTFRTARATATVQDGAWHHVVITRDGDWVRLFIDGVRAHEGGGAGESSAVMPWYVMRNGPFAEHAQGTADDIAVYNRPLSTRSVLDHYRKGAGRVAPDTLVRGPVGAINNPSPRFVVRSDEGGATVRCALNGLGSGLPAIVPCRSRMRFANLQDGSYAFTAYTVDAQGYPDPSPVRTTFRVDTVTPTAEVFARERRVRRLVRLGLPVRVTCSEACSFRTRLVVGGREARRVRLSRGRAVEIGRIESRMTRRGARNVRLYLNATARRRLLKRRALSATLRLSAVDAAGNLRGTTLPMRFR